MTTIIHVIERLTLGGAARVLIGLSKYSSRQGAFRHQVVSLLPAQPQAVELAESEGLEFVQTQSPQALRARLEAADLVHVHWWNAPAVQSFLRDLDTEARLLTWCHVAGDSLPQVITPDLVSHSDVIVATNPYTRSLPVFSELPQAEQNEKVEMIVDPADFERVEGINPIEHSGFNVGYIGTVDFYKMHRRFVPMGASLRIPDLRIQVCGGGIQEQLRAEAHALGAGDRFEFLGYVDDLRPVIETMDVYGYPLCPDTYASGELNLQEVMHAGVPPVVFPYGGVKSLIEHDVTGLIVESEVEYQEAIEHLFHNPEERLRLGRQAAQYARERFGAENAARRLNQVYTRMLRNPKRSRVWGSSKSHLGLSQALWKEAWENSDSENRASQGASLFVDSLGGKAGAFADNLFGSDRESVLASERFIASVSPVVRMAGLQEYLNAFPQDPWLHYWIGLARWGADEPELALQSLATARTLGLKHARCARFLAQAAWDCGQGEMALSALEEAAADAEENEECAELMAFWKHRLGRTNSHPDDLGRNEDALLSEDAIEALIEAGREAEALEHLNSLASSGVLPLDRRMRSAELALRAKGAQLALAFLDSLPVGEEVSPEAMVLRARIHLELEDFEAFERDLGQVLNENPDHLGAVRLLADLNFGHGRYAEAAQGLAKIIQHAGEDIEALLKLAECFEKTGELESARLTFEEILRLEPDNALALEKRDGLIGSIPEPSTEKASSQGGDFEANDDVWVSAIVSTYNGEAYIQACLEDLMQQSLGDRLEILVIDSGSEQNEREIVERMAQNDPRIRYLRTERETLYQAWNRGVALARGRYVVNANNDDSRHPEALAILADALNQNPEAALAYADCHWTDLPNDQFPSNRVLRTVQYPGYHPALALFYCYTGCLQFWRRESLLAIGGFDGGLRAVGDYEVLMRMVEKRLTAVRVQEPLSLFYQNRAGISQGTNFAAEEEHQARQEFRARVKIEDLFSIDPKIARERSLAWYALALFSVDLRVPWLDAETGDEAYAIQCLQRSLENDPSNVKAAGLLLALLDRYRQRGVGVEFLERIDKQRWTAEAIANCPAPDTNDRRELPEPRVPALEYSPAETVVTEQAKDPVSSAQPQEGRSGDDPSVIWYAPFFNPSGYGSEALNFVVPLDKKLPISIRHNSSVVSDTFVAGLVNKDKEALKSMVEREPKAGNLIEVFHGPTACFPTDPNEGAYRIGRTMFETSEIPKSWVEQCRHMDEIWTPTQFNFDAFVRSGVDASKIRIIPGGVDENHFDPKQHRPLRLKGSKKFNFLAVFEWIERKGWDVLLDAYLTEFTSKDDVCLQIRTYLRDQPDSNASDVVKGAVLERAERLGLNLSDLPAVQVVEQQIDYGAMPGLYLAADCLVAPSRGEGWGRPHHESMMMGVPVIATGWGGNMEFMTEENAYLLQYELRQIDALEIGFEAYSGQEWAEPRTAHLKSLMRLAFDDEPGRLAKGKKARADVLAQFTRSAVSDRVAQRLKEIQSQSGCGVVADEQKEAGGNESSASDLLRVAWEGEFYNYGSLAHVNRAIAIPLSKVADLSVQGVARDQPTGPSEWVENEDLSKLMAARGGEEPHVVVRHQWPPNFEPSSSKLVMMQPWEFGTLPAEWVTKSRHVDEFWVYTEHVKQVYVDSGVPDEKVKVMPLGYDHQRFHPGVQALSLPTTKRFKFLFVGGTIPRKGADLALSAYLKAFRSDDDVCLVFKDFGGGHVYAGQTLEEKIRDAQQDPKAPEILYLNEELPSDQIPGLYAACHCLVHPYRGEGFGLPVLEAMGVGLPVVVTRGGACDDFTPEELVYSVPAERQSLPDVISGIPLVRAGWWLEPSLARLTKTLRQVVEDGESAKRKGLAAARYASTHWSWDQAASKMADRLQSMSAEPLGTQPMKRPVVLPDCAKVADVREASALLERGRYAEACEEAVNAILNRPFHPEAILIYGRAALAVNDLSKARQASRLLGKWAPKWKPARKFSRAVDKSRRKDIDANLTKLPEFPSKPRISVCMITKNEEQFLERCLSSVKDWAYEIVIVDTGSTDRTMDIARQHGARVYQAEWQDDFSLARNESLRYVKGDWVLVLDADEVVDPESVSCLHEEASQSDVMAYRLRLRNEGADEVGEAHVPRFFRNAPGLFYLGRIHEQVYSSIEVRRKEWGLKNELAQSRLIHEGYRADVVEARDKGNRNLRLLRLAVEELPDDPNLIMNLGLELQRVGRVDEAVVQYRLAYQIMLQMPEDEIVPEFRETLLTQFSARLLSTGRLDEVVAIFENSALPQIEMTASMHFVHGVSLMNLKRFEQAIDCFDNALKSRQKPTFSPPLAEVMSGAPHHCQALCYMALERRAAALEACERGLAETPSLLACLLDCASLLAQEGRPVEAMERLQGRLSDFSGELKYWITGARISLGTPGFEEFAIDWTGEALRFVSADPELIQMRFEALVRGGKWSEALDWGEGVGLESKDPRIQAMKIAATLFSGRVLSGASGRITDEKAASMAFIDCYRRFIAIASEESARAVHQHLPSIEVSLPTAFNLLRQAIMEAETEKSSH